MHIYKHFSCQNSLQMQHNNNLHSIYIGLHVVHNLEMIWNVQKMCVGYMGTLHYSVQDTWAPVDFGTCQVPVYSVPHVLRDNCVLFF